MAITRKFPKKFMQELVYDEIPEEEAEVLEDTIVDNRRWSIDHSIIFKVGEKYYSSYYSTGATEYQDERPYEFEPDEIECTEVEPRPWTTIQYLPVQEPEHDSNQD